MQIILQFIFYLAPACRHIQVIDCAGCNSANSHCVLMFILAEQIYYCACVLGVISHRCIKNQRAICNSAVRLIDGMQECHDTTYAQECSNYQTRRLPVTGNAWQWADTQDISTCAPHPFGRLASCGKTSRHSLPCAQTWIHFSHLHGRQDHHTHKFGQGERTWGLRLSRR